MSTRAKKGGQETDIGDMVMKTLFLLLSWFRVLVVDAIICCLVVTFNASPNQVFKISSILKQYLFCVKDVMPTLLLEKTHLRNTQSVPLNTLLHLW